MAQSLIEHAAEDDLEGASRGRPAGDYNVIRRGADVLQTRAIGLTMDPLFRVDVRGHSRI